MSKSSATPQDEQAPVAHRVTRGLREGEIRTRAAVNGAPASSTYDAEARTFEFTLLTSRSCNSNRYVLSDGDRWPVYTRVEEKLDMAGAVGLDELVGSSVLNSHRYWDVESVIGVIESATVEGEALNCTARLSRRPDVEPIALDIADGVLRSMSGGFDIVEETLTLREGQDPLVTITKWRPREASVVPVPADPSARIRSGEPYVSKTAKIVAAPAGARAEGDATPSAEELKLAAEAVVTAAKAALAAAEKAVADLTPDADPAPDAAADAGAATDVAKAAAALVERKAHVEVLRGMAARKGGDVLKDFEALAATGAPVSDLRSVCVASLATSGGEISGVSTPTSVGRAESPLKSRSEYAALRAGTR